MKEYDILDIVTYIGEEVELYGWVDTKRDHKKIVFIDLRDRSGIVQIVGNESMHSLSTEDLIWVKGLVKKRPDKLVNPNLATGTIELEVLEHKLISASQPVPIPVNTDGHEINEEQRLRYRYLDLRRPRLVRNLTVRSKLIQYAREFLVDKGFLEIETPMLTKSTPEGSRDFLVPSRMQPGSFYALPQSPQQYKQLLMVAGIERYFQIARCLRDEDLRADRGFEHTQIDMEISFVNRDEMMRLDEEMITAIVERLGYRMKQKPFPIYTYEQAMKEYGADKFDLRTQEDKEQGILAFAWVVDFPFFEKTDQGGWTFTHNPFSAPLPEYKEDLLQKRNIEGILTSQYDLVCNGYEVGGGSIRSHEPNVLRTVFEIIGYERARIEEEFGHVLEAFTYGAPPHGGIAHGVERLLMTLVGEDYLREVVAFPITSGGATAVMCAPTLVTPRQLEELGITIT